MVKGNQNRTDHTEKLYEIFTKFTNFFWLVFFWTMQSIFAIIFVVKKYKRKGLLLKCDHRQARPIVRMSRSGYRSFYIYREDEGMKVSKILNNNLVLSRNAENEEIIVKGLGIGFHAKRGDTIDESLIEKIFYPENHQNSIQIQQYLLSIPEEYLDFVQKFVDQVKKEEPDLRLNNSIYLSLSDHIMGTVERFGNGISLKNVLLLDIQQLYKKEYEYGLKMVEEANRKFNIQLPADEAGFIALHFVNAEEGQQNNDNYQIAMIVNQVQEIVKTYFSDITFNESSLYYQRFLTHLKYFAQRYLHKELQYDEDENLFQIIQEQCREAYGCVKLIYLMMEEKYHYALSKEEMMYLSIHIQTNVDKSRAAVKKAAETAGED